MSKLNVLVAGSTGYIGVQLIKLLVKHKNIKIKYLCGNSSVGKKISFYDKTIKKKLPKITKLKIYTGENHPHAAQNPTMIELSKLNTKNLIRN